MWTHDRPPVNRPLMTWREALEQPGARQMIWGRRLVESRPFLSRIPDPDLLVPDSAPTAVPGAGRYRYCATRDADGSWGAVYAPVGRPFTVNTDRLRGEHLRAWWYNPRNGEIIFIGERMRTRTARFEPPDAGEFLDWVLVLDDAEADYGAPGGPPAG
jgi:hypothetical protein